MLYVQETFINKTEGYRFGDSPIMETYCDTVGEVYRQSMSEYGRCTGKVYRDSPEGGADHIGWVFERRERYEDTGEPYLREVWVIVHDAPPEQVQHVHVIGHA